MGIYSPNSVYTEGFWRILLMAGWSDCGVCAASPFTHFCAQAAEIVHVTFATLS